MHEDTSEQLTSEPAPAAPPPEPVTPALAAESRLKGDDARDPERELFDLEWREAVRRGQEATPELKDENSDLGRTVRELLRETPFYRSQAEGYGQAVALAKARQTAGLVPELQSKLEALMRENDRLVKLTSVTGSGPARRSNEMDHHFDERELRRLAAEADSM